MFGKPVYAKNEENLIDAVGADINISTTTPFSFTLRKCSNAYKSDRSDYKAKLDKFTAMGIQVTDYVYEKNHIDNGLHCHGIMQVPKKFNMKKFRTRGWHIRLDEIYDNAGWLAYITKEAVLEIPELPDNLSDVSDVLEPQIKIPKIKLF